MNVRIQLLIIVLSCVTVAIAPSLITYHPAEAVTQCHNEKGKSANWINGCQVGWEDHDHCRAYQPNQDNQGADFAKGYKVGWEKGSCPK